MLSKMIVGMLDRMESMHQSETQLEAVNDLRTQLEKSAQHQACLRCSKAGHVAIWNDHSKDRQRHNWEVVQTGCGSYRSLPPNEAAGFGFSLANGPVAVYFCDGEDGAGAGADEMGPHERGPGGSGEVERTTPRRRDVDRG